MHAERDSTAYRGLLCLCRVTLSVTTYHPSSLAEVAPAVLPPLAEALTEEQHQQQLDDQQRQVRDSQAGSVVEVHRLNCST